MTDDVLKTRNSLLAIVLILGLICMAVGLIFTDQALMWIVGIALGALICEFRVISMTKSLEKAADMEPADAKNYTRAQYMLRYMITLAIAVIACYKGFANPVGLIVGLVLLQPAVYIYSFFEKRKEKK
ncbi:MAG: ATP synthase subunit I [Clostridia bacterium]|nr:ATP synthase subunit I [Clostridia bacterium]